MGDHCFYEYHYLAWPIYAWFSYVATKQRTKVIGLRN